MKTIDQLRKNLHKTRVYLNGGLRAMLPAGYLSKQLPNILAKFDELEPDAQQAVQDRVDYYNRLSDPFELPADAQVNRDFYRGDKSFSYYMDFKSLVRYFPDHFRYCYWFGDIVDVPDVPRFLKSRPIGSQAENQNSVLLKLNQIRHNYRVRDRLAYEEKADQLVWRGKAHTDTRLRVVQRYSSHPDMDIGDTYKRSVGEPYNKPFLSIPQQLRYKFILSIEGVDVATNLKWIMASNSLCFMRRPRFETWFMEGRLEPGVHYVLLKDDFSDMEEKLDYYRHHPDQAKTIIANAQGYAAQFRDTPRERLISLMVMAKYFSLSGQL